jgi:hypothetical protein
VHLRVRRSAKYTLLTLGIIIALIAGFIAWGIMFPPTYEAAVDLPGTASRIGVQLQPMHPYLAEYRRWLVLHKAGMPDQRVELFADSGGYFRTQLYKLPDGRFRVDGFFDSVIADPVQHQISDAGRVREKGTYLGAFQNVKQGQWTEWRFLSSAESPEETLDAEQRIR